MCVNNLPRVALDNGEARSRTRAIDRKSSVLTTRPPSREVCLSVTVLLGPKDEKVEVAEVEIGRRRRRARLVPDTATYCERCGSVMLQPCMGCRCQGCVRCYNCLGRGFKRCISCHGSGRLWKSDPHGHRHVDSCWRCHGTGRKRYTCVDYLLRCVAASNCRIDSTAIRPPFNQSISLIATLRPESRIANDMQLK